MQWDKLDPRFTKFDFVDRNHAVYTSYAIAMGGLNP
jgi:hypothetical protein